MRATRRRRREPDPLASPSSVRAVCHLLRDRMPDIIPASENQLERFLFAVRHVERRPATDTKRGRPSRWLREKLTEAASLLRALLERETMGRVSVNSFIGQYLPLLHFPADVTDALAKEEVNRLCPKIRVSTQDAGDALTIELNILCSFLIFGQSPHEGD